MKTHDNRAIHLRFTPAPDRKREAHELLMRTIHAVRTDKQLKRRRKEYEKSE